MGRKEALWSERKESHFLNWRYIRFQRLLLLSEQLISGIEKIEASSPRRPLVLVPALFFHSEESERAILKQEPLSLSPELKWADSRIDGSPVFETGARIQEWNRDHVI